MVPGHFRSRKMSEVVFILGAGASVHCGAPVMANFLDRALALQLSRKLNEHDDRAFTTVFEAIGKLQQVHSKAQLDLANIESVFTALELGKTIQAQMFKLSELYEAIAALKTLIVRTLEESISFPVWAEKEVKSPLYYGYFSELLLDLLNAKPRRTASVITFNYDVALDVAIGRRDLGPNYALEREDQETAQVQLLKLHGSLNWAFEPASKKIRPLLWRTYYEKSPFRVQGQTTTIPISTLVRKYFADDGLLVDDLPVIVPPTWNKADHYAMLTNVWASAARHLSEARYVFVIGYSLPETDSFFKHLYALGSVGKNPLLMFRVYDIEERNGPVHKRFRKLLGPVRRVDLNMRNLIRAMAHCTRRSNSYGRSLTWVLYHSRKHGSRSHSNTNPEP